jgi:hypothetical protein
VIRLPLAEGTTRDAVDDLAFAVGLRLVNIVPRTEAFPAQLVYVTPDGAVGAHLVDHEGALTWILRGEEAAEQRWAEAIRAAAEGAS